MRNRKDGKIPTRHIDVKAIFSPVLFWDAGEIDAVRHASYVICRVLDFGNEKDIKKLRSIYPDEKLIEVIKSRRSLLPRTGKFWALYFKIPLEEIACLSKYYQKAHWKS